MHKKISVGVTVALMIVTLMITAMITTAVTMNVYSGLVSDLPEREQMYDALSEADNVIRSEYYGDFANENVDCGIISGYVNGLTEGKNSYMTTEEYSKYKTEMTGVNPDDESKLTSVTFNTFGTTGYIRISAFYDTTANEFKKAYESLAEKSVTGLVIDVRDTDSINISTAAEIIDMIVPLGAEGTEAIATAIGKDGKSIEVFSSDSDSINLPCSVIVNENTSGAGELIACDLRDFGKATVVGVTTAGNGMFQKIYELSDGSAMVLTIGKLLPYKSDCYEDVGVIPDYVVNASVEVGGELNKDNQFLQAYASVQEK